MQQNSLCKFHNGSTLFKILHKAKCSEMGALLLRAASQGAAT
jgi:hypothetical protein